MDGKSDEKKPASRRRVESKPAKEVSKETKAKSKMADDAHVEPSASAVPTPSGPVLSQDMRLELDSLISAKLQNYFGEEDDEFWLGQGGGADPSLDIDLGIDSHIDNVVQDVDEVPSGQAPGAGDLVDECLAEILVVPRKGKAVPDNVSSVVNNAFLSKLSDEVRAAKLKMFEIPQNCPGLDKVKVNQTIWDKIKPATRTMDVKLQSIQQGIVAAGAGLCKLVQDVQAMEPDKINKPTLAQLTKDLLNIQVVLGQSNVDLNHRRRELIKPDLNSQFHHLCTAAVPFTEWLFGDELKDNVKEIADANRVCGKIFPQSGNRGRGRGAFRGRFQRYQPYNPPYAGGRGGGYRGRGGYGYGRYGGYGYGRQEQQQAFLGQAQQAKKPAKKE